MKKEILYLVVPCFNEELIIEKSISKLTEKIDKMIEQNIISEHSKICFVDDGSVDKTWNIITNNSKINNKILGIKLAHNKGHQTALFTGLMTIKDYADIVITIDADLQQDINMLDKFVEEYYNGNDIVYGIRNSRKTDGFFKKMTATLFYNLMNSFGCETIKNHADYRLTSKKVLQGLAKYKESNLFLRGIFPNMGFKSTKVYFDVYEREAGKTKYTLKKMINLATDGITSFSIKPLRMIFSFGIFLIISSLLWLIISLILNISSINLILSSIFLSCGLVIMSLGIIGEYIGKINIEAKSRPVYLIDEFLDFNIKNTINC